MASFSASRSEKHGGALDALVYRILGPVGEGIAPKEIGYA